MALCPIKSDVPALHGFFFSVLFDLHNILDGHNSFDVEAKLLFVVCRLPPLRLHRVFSNVNFCCKISAPLSPQFLFSKLVFFLTSHCHCT